MCSPYPCNTTNQNSGEPLSQGWLLLQMNGEEVEAVSLPDILPEELLLSIFECMAQEDHDVSDNISLMLVCKRWRALVTHTRPLWTTIRITLDSYSQSSLLCAQIQTCFEHSQNAMLDITVEVYTLLEMDVDEDEELDEITTPSIIGERMFKDYIEIMRTLTGEKGERQTHRWRSFHIWLASGLDDRAALYLLRCLTWPMPNLQELGIHLGFSPNAEISWETGEIRNILPSLTALKTLSIDHRFVLGLQAFRPSLIVELTLIDTPALREFLTIGSQFTSIQRLIVDLRDRSVISGRDVALPTLAYLKASGWFVLELISHIDAGKLVDLDIADADFTGSILVGSQAYASVKTLLWRSRDPAMMNSRACVYVTLLAFLLTQCSVLVEIQIWRKHQHVFREAITKAMKEGPVLKLLRRLKIFSSGWEFNQNTLEETVELAIPGD